MMQQCRAANLLAMTVLAQALPLSQSARPKLRARLPLPRPLARGRPVFIGRCRRLVGTLAQLAFIG
jgi:hypothetical protein